MRNIAIALCILLAGCVSGSRPAPMQVHLSIINNTGAQIREAQARFYESSCRWGTVAPYREATVLYFPLRFSKEVELTWEESGFKKSRTLNMPPVDPDIRSGHITFTVVEDGVNIHVGDMGPG
jgi:hypothetical protein